MMRRWKCRFYSLVLDASFFQSCIPLAPGCGSGDAVRRWH